MPRTSDARSKAIVTAERLVRTQGAAATGLAQIIAESGSPKGSFYFHFPGGKEELLLAMLDQYADAVLAAIKRLAVEISGDGAAFAEAFCMAIAADMERDDFAQGCALQALTDEYANTRTPIAHALKAHNERWISALADALNARGTGLDESRRLALWLTTMAQGARILARLQRSKTPFEAVRSSIKAVFS